MSHDPFDLGSTPSRCYGLRWRCNKRHCGVPPGMAVHKSKTVKGDKSIDFPQSALISQTSGTLVSIGSRKYKIQGCFSGVGGGGCLVCETGASFGLGTESEKKRGAQEISFASLSPVLSRAHFRGRLRGREREKRFFHTSRYRVLQNERILILSFV